MLDLHKQILAKFHMTRLSQGDINNPFKDVKIVRKEQDDAETISVQLDTIEELDINALEKLIAELIAADLVRNNSIQITTQRFGISTNMRYEGRLTIKKEPEELL